MNRRDRRAARKSQMSPVAGTPAALYEAGLGHMQAARHLDAQICCQQALAADANHADSLHLMGLLCLQAQQYDHAVEWIARAIRQSPKAAYLSSLGVTLQRQGRHEEALNTFDKAIQLKPDDAELWTKLGSVLTELQRLDDAILGYQQALKLNPRHWNATHECGGLFFRLGRFGEALIHFNLCDELQPNQAPTLQMRALTLYGLNKFDDGLTDIRRAHALDPTNADLCNNLGVFFRRLGREEEALPWFDKALEIRPDFLAVVGKNKAFALTGIRRFAEAFAVYGEMKAADPDNTEADLNTSLLQLLTGNFEVGCAGREVRWKAPGMPIRHLNVSQRKWLGKEPIDGKTILIYADEGLGDSIQFVRYVPMLVARGARVILWVEDTLCPLLCGLSGVAQCIPLSAGTPTAFDIYCPISSLAAAFDTRLETIPSITRYLTAPAESRLRDWQDRLGPHDRLRVGLVWSGNPKHTNDHNRSIPLRTLTRILDVDATFVSLQKDPRPTDQTTLLERTEIVDLTAHLTDFTETAALVSCFDLVITVDTSVAHLAGALGCPTWILLPHTPDWRWLLDRDDSPWYPTVRLFRQNETRDYADVLDRVREQLLTRIAAFSSAS
jgi:tetratricopeptide (TPR) repeat protein